MADPELDEADVRRILALATTLNKKSGKTTLTDLQSGAADIGLAPEMVKRAYDQLRHEQRRRRAILILVLLCGLGLAAIVGLVMWAVRPVPFTANSSVRITSLVKDGKPTDALKTVKLFSRREFQVYVSLTGLTENHKMRCDIVSAKDGTRIHRSYLQLEHAQENHWLFFSVTLPWETPPGDYEIQIFAEEQLINEEPLVITTGNARMTTAKVLEKGMYAAPLVTTFSREKDKTAYARVDWDDLRGEKLDVEFRWTDASAKELRRFAFVLEKSDGLHWAWDPLDLASAPDGVIKVRSYVEGIYSGETTITVGP